MERSTVINQLNRSFKSATKVGAKQLGDSEIKPLATRTRMASDASEVLANSGSN